MTHNEKLKAIKDAAIDKYYLSKEQEGVDEFVSLKKNIKIDKCVNNSKDNQITTFFWSRCMIKVVVEYIPDTPTEVSTKSFMHGKDFLYMNLNENDENLVSELYNEMDTNKL